MKAKEKAGELYAKFLAITAEDSIDSPISVIKKPIGMALLCVEEILKSLEKLLMETYTGYYVKEIARERDFYEEVKDELNKMK